MEPVDSLRKRVLIVGASETGLALARTLCTTWEVAVLDSNPERLQPLRDLQLPEARLNLLTKDGTSLLNLKDAGLLGADWVIALTERDEANVEVCRAVLSVEPPSAAIAVVGRAAAQEQLKELGAEALHDSLIVGETAYTCEPGFVGEVIGAAQPTATSGLHRLEE